MLLSYCSLKVIIMVLMVHNILDLQKPTENTPKMSNMTHKRPVLDFYDIINDIRVPPLEPLSHPLIAMAWPESDSALSQYLDVSIPEENRNNIIRQYNRHHFTHGNRANDEAYEHNIDKIIAKTCNMLFSEHREETIESMNVQFDKLNAKLRAKGIHEGFPLATDEVNN
jgi:hypothetical protein